MYDIFSLLEMHVRATDAFLEKLQPENYYNYLGSSSYGNNIE